MLDLPIDLPRARSAKDARFVEYRERLLAALGVREDGPEAAGAAGEAAVLEEVAA